MTFMGNGLKLEKEQDKEKKLTKHNQKGRAEKEREREERREGGEACEGNRKEENVIGLYRSLKKQFIDLTQLPPSPPSPPPSPPLIPILNQFYIFAKPICCNKLFLAHSKCFSFSSSAYRKKEKNTKWDKKNTFLRQFMAKWQTINSLISI